MKTRLGARIGSKNPRRRVQIAPKHERVFGIQEYHSALLECQIGLFWALAQWPSGDNKAYPFRSFCRRMSPNSYSTLQGYFLEIFGLYNSAPFFLHSERHAFGGSQFANTC